MAKQIHLVKTLPQLKALADYIAGKEFIAYDVETTGTDKESIITDFAVCAEVGDVDIAYCVQTAHWDPVLQKLVYYETHEEADEFLRLLRGKRLIMQNGPFDCWMTSNNYGVELIHDLEIDTLALGHLLNENRLNGLKERGVELYGEDAREEQRIMKESVVKNGGVLTKEKYELYKADSDLRAQYCAQDTILTMNVACHDLPILYAEKLDKFYFEETMPLMRGPTYQMNTTGLRVDPEKLSKLKGELEVQIMKLEVEIYAEIEELTKEKYPKGFGKKPKHFNIGAAQQIAWLLFEKLENPFHMLTKSGQAMCKEMGIKRPYSDQQKREFIEYCEQNVGKVWKDTSWNYKTKKWERPKKIQKALKYMSVGKETAEIFSKRYTWVAKLVEHAKAKKLLNTYVIGIQKRMKYNIIRPSFMQCGTTSGRYACKNPNFQNLPRKEKRLKACIVAREGKVLVAADYSQLEPRVFASVSQDEALMGCFASGDDFYSVVGVPIFDTAHRCTSLKKDVVGSFSVLYPDERQISKEDVALATPYGTSAWKMAASTGLPVERCREIIELYFSSFPKVRKMMLDSHEQAKTNGVVYTLFGRPRRIPKAMKIPEIFGDTPHDELPYEWRTILNLAMNHRVQGTGANIMNRAAIAFYDRTMALSKSDPRWLEVPIVMQVHDELIVEGPAWMAQMIADLLKDCMENTSKLPGVALVTEPKIGLDLASVK